MCDCCGCAFGSYAYVNLIRTIAHEIIINATEKTAPYVAALFKRSVLGCSYAGYFMR